MTALSDSLVADLARRLFGPKTPHPRQFSQEHPQMTIEDACHQRAWVQLELPDGHTIKAARSASLAGHAAGFRLSWTTRR